MRKLLIAAAVFTFACGGEEDEHEAHDLDEVEAANAFSAAFDDVAAGKADSTGCNGVVVPDQGQFGKRVALTFDDGPNPATTPKVMEVLRRFQAPATFFINGRRVKDDATRAIAQEIVDDPLFILANHTWSHAQMTGQHGTDLDNQIDRTTEVIEAAGGEAKWFRFPYGASNCRTADAVKERGYTITGWHIDSADWCFAPNGGHCRPSTFRHVPDDMRRDMLAWTMKQVRRHNGGVALFHDIHSYTAENLEAILEAMVAEGFTFVNIDNKSAFPQLNGHRPAFIGDLCLGHEDCDYEDGFCHRAGFCSAECEGYCPDQTGSDPTFCAPDPDRSDEFGICVSKATDNNGSCADLEGTIDRTAERFIGTSGALPASAEVCLPAPE